MSEILAAAVVFGFSLGFSEELAKYLRRWFRRYRRAHRMGPPKGSYGPAHLDWRLCRPDDAPNMKVSLPANALPLPTPEATND